MSNFCKRSAWIGVFGLCLPMMVAAKDGDHDWGLLNSGKASVKFDVSGSGDDHLTDLIALSNGNSLAVGMIDCLSTAGCIGMTRLSRP